MQQSFPVFDVTDWPVTDFEPGGDEEKYWVRGNPDEVGEDQAWLWKQVTIKQLPAKGGGTRPYQQGEDWAEKISFELAVLCGLPSARVELARRDGKPGLLSLTTLPLGWTMHGGGVHLAGVDSRYRPKTASDVRRNRIGHNLQNVAQVLHGAVGSPPQHNLVGLGGFDVFAGFLIFDAWIANRDRHESNWGVLQDPQGGLSLSPSFDHGAALGSGLEDPRRLAMLEKPSAITEWCNRGTAHRFEDCHEVTLLDLAMDAMQQVEPEVRDYWLARVCDVKRVQWQTVLDRVPMSAAKSRFVDELLTINQGRIRDEWERDRRARSS